MTDNRAIIDLAMSEQSLQEMVIGYAKWNNWMIHHQLVPFRGTYGNYRAIVEPGTDPGYPDLFLCRDQEAIFVELKSERGKLSPDQIRWRDALILAGQRWYLWRPSTWAEAEKVLAR